MFISPALTVVADALAAHDYPNHPDDVERPLRLAQALAVLNGLEAAGYELLECLSCGKPAARDDACDTCRPMMEADAAADRVRMSETDGHGAAVAGERHG
jgi:hypothetical protein